MARSGWSGGVPDASTATSANAVPIGSRSSALGNAVGPDFMSGTASGGNQVPVGGDAHAATAGGVPAIDPLALAANPALAAALAPALGAALPNLGALGALGGLLSSLAPAAQPVNFKDNPVRAVAEQLRRQAESNVTNIPVDPSSKPARKIYVGNLPPSVVSEAVITQFFNRTLAALLPNKPPGDSIISTYLNTQKRFAFIENRSIEETQFTLGLDGILMDEYSLKLRRPQDYDPQAAQIQLANEMRLKGGVSALRGAWNPMSPQTSVTAQGATETALTGPGIVSTSVEDGPNKVFIGGLPHHMTEHEVKELLSAYGPLKAFHLVKDRENDRSKGFAFCEWRDSTLTDVAINSLNGMKLGDRLLNVRRAIPHAAAKSGMLQPALQGPQQPAQLADTSAAPPLALTYLQSTETKPLTVEKKTLGQMALPDISSCLHKEPIQSSRCLALRKVVQPHDWDPSTAAETMADLLKLIKSRASEIGRVRSCQFHHGEGGRILVEFSSAEEAAAAQKFFSRQDIDGVITSNSELTEMIPEMRKACMDRIAKEVEFLSRMDPSARAFYNEKESQKAAALRQQRDRIVKAGHLPFSFTAPGYSSAGGNGGISEDDSRQITKKMRTSDEDGSGAALKMAT